FAREKRSAMDVNVLQSRGSEAAGAVAFSALAQIAAKAGHLALNVVVNLALVYSLGPAAYGDYVLVITLVTLIGLAADLGLSRMAVREIARDESATPTVLGTATV